VLIIAKGLLLITPDFILFIISSGFAKTLELSALVAEIRGLYFSGWVTENSARTDLFFIEPIHII
jgi:hypothetical protein